MIRRAEKTALEKKFDHAVHAAMWRSRGSLSTTWSPSDISVSTARRWPGSGVGSRLRMATKVAAEKKKEAASKIIATGALNNSMTVPANAGPPVLAMELLVSNLLFASTSCLRSTRAGRYAWYATSKKTVRIPMRNEKTYR